MKRNEGVKRAEPILCTGTEYGYGATLLLQMYLPKYTYMTIRAYLTLIN